MFLFGPISSLFDFATFALMLFVFNAVPGEFRAGWFIESIATQTLIIFAIRTRRVPFLRSRPSAGLLVRLPGRGGPRESSCRCRRWPRVLGFDPLPVPFFLALLAMIVLYLVLVEIGKHWFFSRAAQQHDRPDRRLSAGGRRTHHIARRAARFSTPAPVR